MALLEVKNLHTYFKTRKGIVKAVNDVSYSLDSGKTIGIVGESGSGKSVSAMSILQLLDGNSWSRQYNKWRSYIRRQGFDQAFTTGDVLHTRQ